jgi:hypothetical protein
MRDAKGTRDRRRVRRQGVSTPARLVSFDGRILARVRLHNLSEMGSQIALGVTPLPPGRFLLQLPDKTVRICRVIWWDGDRAGVAFEPPPEGTGL